MSKVIRCQNCGEKREVGSITAMDIEGCVSDDSELYAEVGLHKFEVVATLSKSNGAGKNENNKTKNKNWKEMDADELKKRHGLKRINGVVWGNAGGT